MNFKSAIDLMEEGGFVIVDIDADGDPVMEWMNGLTVEFDTKRKLSVDGWEVGGVGTHTLRWDKENRQFSHSFRPFGYLFIPTEAQDCLELAANSLRATALKFWGKHILFAAATSDRLAVCK